MEVVRPAARKVGDVNFTACVNQTVAVTTDVHPTPLVGKMACFDLVSGTFVLKIPTEPGSMNRHWVLVRASHVTSFEPMNGTADQLDDDEEIMVDMDRVTAREQRAHDKALEDARHVNTQVTNEVMNVYNALRKTMPCLWDGVDIVVMDSVRIKGPGYRAQDCEGSDSNSLERVKLVVRARAPAWPHPRRLMGLYRSCAPRSWMANGGSSRLPGTSKRIPDAIPPTAASLLKRPPCHRGESAADRRLWLVRTWP